MGAVEHPREFNSAITEVDRIRLTGLARKKIRDVECRLAKPVAVPMSRDW
jgi:hypothetical protein